MIDFLKEYAWVAQWIGPLFWICVCLIIAHRRSYRRVVETKTVDIHGHISVSTIRSWTEPPSAVRPKGSD